MQTNMWNKRYGETSYIYGKKPNRLFKNFIDKETPGTILFPAEGEGRNAVYAACLGWKVHAFDSSTEGQKKALKLAAENQVNIDYKVVGYEDVKYEECAFDCIVLSFAHMPASIRPQIHQKLLRYLKPGGKLFLVGFSQAQLGLNSGGPKDLSMLYSKESLQKEFTGLSQVQTESCTDILEEGNYHVGEAKLIQLIGTK